MSAALARPRPAPSARRRPIDVEELLVWTYKRQRADIVIDRGIGLIGAEADVEGVSVQGGSNLSVVERVMKLGCFVDRGGMNKGDLHPDAEIVHGVVKRLDQKISGLPLSWLLISHAREGSRPDAMVGQVPRPVALRHWRTGDVTTIWTDAGRRSGYCPVEYEPSLASIDAARFEYSAWRRGLGLVALQLHQEKLVMWWPRAPGAPVRPWEGA